MDLVFMVIDTVYLKKYGIIKCIRFSRCFNDFHDLLVYLFNVPDPEKYKVITLSKYDFDDLKERNSKLCF